MEEGTLDLIRRFMSDEKFNEFNLVDGTALALMIGHRKSIDIDLFSGTAFNAVELASHLTANYKATEVRPLNNAVFCKAEMVKIDLIAHQFPLVGEIEHMEGIRMVSLLDLGAMKLNAIYKSGTRLKDFVDMYSLLEKYPLNQMLDACRKKYSESNIDMVKKSLVYHHDIIFMPIQYLKAEVKWPAIAERLQNAWRHPDMLFDMVQKATKQQEQKASDNRGRRKGLGL